MLQRRSTRSVQTLPRPALRALCVLACLSIVGAGLLGVTRAGASSGANWSRMTLSGLDRQQVTAPEPTGTDVTAGPWTLNVVQVLTGGEATDLVVGASSFNDPPAEGATYVAVQIRATNNGGQKFRIDFNDFAVAGSNGVIRRFIGAIVPEPALDGVVDPGGSIEGWVIGGARADDDGLILIYDSVTLTGDWADAAFALSPGASFAAATDREFDVNKIGRDPREPVAIGSIVATRQWSVQVNEVVTGDGVAALYPDSDRRTTALIGSGSLPTTWIAFRVTVTNNATGSTPSYLPVTAFTIADSDGNPVPDLLWLSPPSPDAAGEYLPGASRDGWVVFDLDEYTGSLLRFLPFQSDEDARYITWDGSGVTSPSEPAFSGTLEEGTNVVTTEDLVNLRSEPSTDAEVVEEMKRGTKLVVTGPPEEAAGLTWYPVEDPKTGNKGYVAQQFIDLDD